MKEIEEERKHYVRELKRSNEELNQFAYTASHDLKEPLRMVSTFLTLLDKQNRHKLDAESIKYINFALEGTQRMKVLIDDLLTYSLLGNSGPRIEEVSLDEVLKATLFNLSQNINETGTVVTSEPLPVVQADFGRCVQLFQNLISNGIKFHRSRVVPRISIRAEEKDNNLVVSISDNGIGITKDKTAQVFGVFQRLNPRKEYPGTGIGLATCKKIVEMFGGKIWLTSTPNEGTTFYFSLPLEPSNIFH